MTKHNLCIGVGNPYRHDDGLGWVVAQALPLPVKLLDGEGASLLEAWQGYRAVWVVDAVRAGGTPGTIYRWEASQPLPAALHCSSSHAFGVAQALELGRMLGLLPPRLVFYGIEGADFSPGQGFSPPVAQAVNSLIHLIQQEVLSA